jgi:uncharacterized protein
VAGALGGEPLGIAFSGGVDSALLLAIAMQALGAERTLAVLAVSPSLAASERASARAVANYIGARLVEVETHEMDVPEYVANPVDRCYFCKDEFFARLDDRFLARHNLAGIAYGENADDAERIDRPGARAATRHRVLRPLAVAGLSKARVRSLARELGLPVSDKPAAPCLASRIPHGQPVTAAKLRSVDEAEEALRGLGFSDSRVRHHGDIARIELPTEEMSMVVDPDIRRELVKRVRAAGFRHVTIDLLGIQSGALTLQLMRTRG